MKTIRRVQAIAAIAGLAIGLAGSGQAQSNPAADQKHKPAADKKSESAPKSSAEEPKKKGAGEGIQVHGHWTIEVKDPDGKVAVHREFENSLFGGGNGASVLSSVLLGSAAIGGFQVLLGETPTGGGQELLIVDTAAWPCAVTNPSVFCSTGVLTASSVLNGFVLNGQIVGTPANPVPAGIITEVNTGAFLCSNSSNPTTYSPSSCTSSGPAVGTGVTFLIPTFTSATLATPIPVSAGQTIAANVQISFQ